MRKPRIWKMWEHSDWGNSMSWLDFDNRRITGHLTPKPQVGDEVETAMQSGGIAVFRVTKVDHCEGVRDMFFVNVEDVGYRGDEERRTVA